jgi:hypothetical protein
LRAFAAILMAFSGALDSEVASSLPRSIHQPSGTLAYCERQQQGRRSARAASSADAQLPAQTEAEATAATSHPLQIIGRTRLLPKLTIYPDGLKELAATMKSLLTTSYEVVLRSKIDGVDVRRLASDFWSLLKRISDSGH